MGFKAHLERIAVEKVQQDQVGIIVNSFATVSDLCPSNPKSALAILTKTNEINSFWSFILECRFQKV